MQAVIATLLLLQHFVLLKIDHCHLSPSVIDSGHYISVLNWSFVQYSNSTKIFVR